MEKLREAGLIGKGLLPIDKPILVDRYNKCLDEIGLPPTSLKKFSIDGWGWSPEIAEEQNNKFYLSHGGPANPYMILLSPKQEGRPIYFPYHSFDRIMMREVFNHCRNQIKDLTTQTAIWVDVDQEISTYTSPQDLMMIDSFVLKFFSIGRLMTAAREQRQLVRKFYEERYAWGDGKLRDQIIESCNQYGDLRFRSLDIPDFPFTHVRSFYSRAFDGLFILRDLPGGKPLLILENPGNEVLGENGHGYVEYLLKDKKLSERLLEEKLIELNLDFYRINAFHIKRLKEYYFVDAWSRLNPEEDVTKLNNAKQKGWVVDLKSKKLLNETYFELEKFERQLSNNSHIHPNDFSEELKFQLMRPNNNLSETRKKAVWQLLVKLFPNDILWLYAHDKEEFLKQYAVWPESKKKWAVNLLQHDYIPTFYE